MYSHHGDVLEIENIIFTHKNIIVWHGGFIRYWKEHTNMVKNARDQILAQTIPSYNILGKLHFSEAQILPPEKPEKL